MKLNKLELIKLLIEESNLHFNHPSEVARKVIFSLGTVLTTIVATTIFSNVNDSDFVLKTIFHTSKFKIVLAFVFVDYLFILWGLNEHTKIHSEQRKRHQNAIDYLMSVDNYDESNFWKTFGKNRLRYYWNLKMERPSLLFTAEPDTRGFLGFYDRKIELGIILILTRFIMLLMLLF
ncbi:hypothetical protein Q4Q35_09380 [Flavivirga aquimarina]|uniref:SMODS and SLOG-associating 2TM effector domain-containing protein n=1 Tax=Flavivirga aquimarina TaxID=2027862 RepID=A0ABT8WA88_9FLAO|nr:hypothetical protein [Flavivirga aquimarina]MDO5970020.1 hypothetical protein [Flavivirga aquimarina]